MAARATEEKINGVQKAAILMIALGPEKSAAIFKHLKEDEVEELTLEIANTRSVTPQLKESVVNEFYQVCLAQQYIAEGGINYAKELLEKSFGADKAMDVIGKLTASLQVKPFEFRGARDFEYGGPRYGKTYHGNVGDRGAGACGRDQKEDVCLRGYPAFGRPRHSACAA